MHRITTVRQKAVFRLVSDMLAYLYLRSRRKDCKYIIYQTTGVVERARVLLSMKKKSIRFALKSNILSTL